MPRAFARLHPRYRTPHVALIVQSMAASAIFLASVFFSVAGRTTSIQEAYDILVNLTILIYFIPYLYLFAAQVKLLPDAPRWPAALGFAATAISLALTFVPPPGSNALTYEVNSDRPGRPSCSASALRPAVTRSRSPANRIATDP